MGADIDIGRLVAGKYELVRLIGKGAMGEVWLASHNTLGGEFAIKLVKPSDEDEDESAAGRFQLEAQISAKLSRRTRHIVSVSDHGEEPDGLAYLVMELLEGEPLEQRITRSVRISLVEILARIQIKDISSTRRDRRWRETGIARAASNIFIRRTMTARRSPSAPALAGRASPATSAAGTSGPSHIARSTR